MTDFEQDWYQSMRYHMEATWVIVEDTDEFSSTNVTGNDDTGINPIEVSLLLSLYVNAL